MTKKLILPFLVLLIAVSGAGCSHSPFVVYHLTDPKIVALAHEYPQVIAQAKSAGLPMSLSEMSGPMPPANQNAGPLYLQLGHDTSLITRDRSAQVEVTRQLRFLGLIEQLGKQQIPTGVQLSEARQELSHRAKLVSLVHDAAVRPRCVFTHNWSSPTPQAILFPEFLPMRNSARILTVQSLMLASQGKSLDAVANQALGFHIADQTTDGDKALIAYLVELAVQGITFSGMNRILYMSHGDPKVASAVEAAINRDYHQPSLAMALRGENAFDQGVVAFMRRKNYNELDVLVGDKSKPKGKNPNWAYPGSPAWNEFLDANSAFMLREVMKEVPASDEPYWVSLPVMKAISVEIYGTKRPEHIIAAIVMPSSERAVALRAQLQAMAEVTEAGAAVLVWKGAHGRFPDTLSQAMPVVPADPFDGKPLRYRREGEGFVIYSVGRSGKFDGGTPTVKPPAREAVFRYPAPAYLMSPSR